MKGNLWIVAVLVVTLGVAAVAIPGVLSGMSETVHVTQEEQTLDSNGTQLDEAGASFELYQNETVVETENGTELTRGEEYTLDYNTGILAANQSDYDGTEVLVNYTYNQPQDDRTGEIAALLGVFNPVLPFLVVVGVLATLLAMVTRG